MFPYEIYQFYESATVADPDLHGLIWSKNKGGPGPPGLLPWIRHCGYY